MGLVVDAIEPMALETIRGAQRRLRDLALRTPLVRMPVAADSTEVFLKLENLQPMGCFKVRGAGNAMLLAEPESLAAGVCTASAGNMAMGVAYVARRLGLRAATVVPEHAPQAKLQVLERLGATIVKLPFEQWWSVIESGRCDELEGRMIHPVSDPAVIAGNGTIGLEILEQLPEVDAVVIPYGGGGLSGGIASAIRALKPSVRIYAAEVETAAPLAASLAAGAPCPVEHRASFVDGIGGRSILPELWPMARDLLDGSLVVSLEQTAGALRLLATRSHVVGEGAAGAAVAAALAGLAGAGRVACVVSGGNIDLEVLAVILRGGTPGCADGARHDVERHA